MENAINTVNKIDFEFIQWYEIDAEICWLNYGLLKDLWEVDHTIFFIVEISGYHSEFDYYVNQCVDNDQINFDGFDLGMMECLCDDDLCQNSYVFNLNLSNDIMDIFWEAEKTESCFTSNTWYTEYRDYFS